jgi:mannose-6-phosphate isomerase-like protein (cupin superfamily)
VAGYVTNIEDKTLENDNFRQVLYTAPGIQLVLMTIGVGDEIGLETHDREHALEDGSAVVIPRGTEHNIVNVSKSEPLKLYSIYTPPEHPDGTVHRTKADADAYEREHHHK